MAEAGHYSVFYWKPHPSSHLAFLVEAMSILDREPDVPIWSPPIVVPRGTPPEVAQPIERANRNFLAPIDRVLRDDVRRELEGVGADTDSPAAAAYIGQRVAERRQLWRLVDQASQASPAKPFSWEPASVAIANVTRGLPTDGKRRSERGLRVATIEKLNEGIPEKDKGHRLRPHHVLRATARYTNDSVKFGNRMLRLFQDRDEALKLTATALLWAHFAVVLSLSRIEREAKSRPEYRNKSGASLAHAIERTHGMAACLERAVARIDRAKSA
ncbi:hypothetical protein [Aquibium microcysteis]|uniref:hypothetical protein n=1 Tax=Aquibium microcysteis TaxID=675281 RepID=UPI00165D1B5F|nr:hypothetical protein [Aquibium microcysteis]